MTKPFTPYTAEKTVTVNIKAKEAVLLQKLRRYSYGTFTVYKANGTLVRIEINDSQMIDEDEVELDGL